MRRMRWTPYLWPGLPALWVRGSWTALAVALAAALALNLALVATVGYSEWVAPAWEAALWLAVAAIWATSAALAWAGGRGQGSPGMDDAAKDGYATALEHYLKGDWFQAERLLVDQLRRRADDAEARLALATLLRHAGRFDEAAAELDRLARLDGAARWEWELRRERELLGRAATRRGNDDAKHAGQGKSDPPAGMVHAA